MGLYGSSIEKGGRGTHDKLSSVQLEALNPEPKHAPHTTYTFCITFSNLNLTRVNLQWGHDQ